MTREEAIDIMKAIIYMLEPMYDTDRVEDAVSMAIKALEQETVSRDVYDHEYDLRKEFEIKAYKLQRQLERVEHNLDKIREEVELTRKMYLDMNDIDWLNGCDYVLSVIDKYKKSNG